MLNTLPEGDNASEGRVVSLKDITLIPGQGVVFKTMGDEPME